MFHNHRLWIECLLLMTDELKNSNKRNCFVSLVEKKITMFLLVVYIYLLTQFE